MRDRHGFPFAVTGERFVKRVPVGRLFDAPLKCIERDTSASRRQRGRVIRAERLHAFAQLGERAGQLFRRLDFLLNGRGNDGEPFCNGSFVSGAAARAACARPGRNGTGLIVAISANSSVVC